LPSAGARGTLGGLEPAPREPGRIPCALLAALVAALVASCLGPGRLERQGLTRGMDPDGRIPKVALPPDVPHPERWRYFPEGRLVEGNLAERLLVSTFAVPVFFFRSDVGAGGGLSLTDIDFRNQRRREFATTTLTYTSEGQQSYNFLWRRWLDHRDLPQGGVIQEERSFVRFFAGYTKTLTRRFFGLGPETEEDAETSYTEEVPALELGFQRSLPEAGGDWVVHAGVRVEKRNLSRGFVEGVPDTADDFPEEFRDGDGLASLWVGGGLRYDTQDSQANPYRGWSLGTWIDAAPLVTGGRSGARYGLDGSLAVPLPPLLHEGGDDREENPPTDVLAATFQVQDSSGELPFWARPSLGGSSRLRGYIANRFTGAAAWFAALEYRLVLVPRGYAVTDTIRVERFGLGLFYELGAVAPELHELDTAEVHDSVGLGLRMYLERSAVFRLDLGFSDEDTNLAVVYGLSF
jgi:hypothetical protein